MYSSTGAPISTTMIRCVKLTRRAFHLWHIATTTRNMCEACLLSFATEKESDCDTYKALVGILHKDLECFVEDDSHIHLSLHPGKKDDIVQVLEKSSIYCCSCCGEPLKVKSSYSKGKGAAAYSVAPASSPRTPVVGLRNDQESRNSDLAHIRYTELKFISENNSPPEDEDGLNALNPDTQCEFRI